MRRIARAAAWVVKAVLGLVALTAAVLWPLSYRQEDWISAARSRGEGDRLHLVYLMVTSSRGRIDVVREHGDFEGDGALLLRLQARVPGPDWRFERNRRALPETSEDWPSGWGSIRWGARDWVVFRRGVSAPAWLVAVATGAWPLISVTRLVRRRAERRHRARAGRCLSCGYDLRATPAPTGPRLPRCPECGGAEEAVDPRMDANGMSTPPRRGTPGQGGEAGAGGVTRSAAP